MRDGTWIYTWQNGRELATMKKGTTTWRYTYDANGMRTRRTNGTKTCNYEYNGSPLSGMAVGSDNLYFTYGALGPTTVTWNGTTYYFALNAQGDASGTCVITYNWGNARDYNPKSEGRMNFATHSNKIWRLHDRFSQEKEPRKDGTRYWL